MQTRKCTRVSIGRVCKELHLRVGTDSSLSIFYLVLWWKPLGRRSRVRARRAVWVAKSLRRPLYTIFGHLGTSGASSFPRAYLGTNFDARALARLILHVPVFPLNFFPLFQMFALLAIAIWVALARKQPASAASLSDTVCNPGSENSIRERRFPITWNLKKMKMSIYKCWVHKR